MPTSKSREEKASELNYVLRTLFLRRESDNLYLVVKSNRCKSIIDLITLVAINSEASKLHPFEISLISTLKKFISNIFSKKDTRLITLNKFNTFLLEKPAKERNSFESTIAALPHLTLLKDSTTSSIVNDQAEFNCIIKIVLELED